MREMNVPEAKRVGDGAGDDDGDGEGELRELKVLLFRALNFLSRL